MLKEGILKGEQLPYLLALLRTPRLGSLTLIRLFESGLSPKSLYSLPRSELCERGFHADTIEKITNPPWLEIEQELDWLEKDGNHLLTLDDRRYPELLKQIDSAPIALYIKGNPDVLNSVQIGMVGSRHPSADGCRLALAFSRALAELGITITSGLAIGIDSHSHLGAIQSHFKTIAVLGNGLCTIYPASNRKLAASILEKGALVSEFPLDVRPLPGNFPRRNRIISGLSTGVLVVEAALNSGSLITARCAIDQGRDVFAIPGSIHNPMARGCHSLIRDGAKLVEQIQDITEEFGPLAAVISKNDNLSEAQQYSTMGLDAKTKLLLDSIGYQPVIIDTLVEETGITPALLSSCLLNLELEGWIESLPGGGYIRRS
ncbi:MAG: DNA-protecting protein DprA [Gammaproteobacteria bacterium]|nr:DNA-protecting protein DprA [Gammaproteobacteria bacterium]